MNDQAEPKPHWTRTHPTVPGLYWMRNVDAGHDVDTTCCARIFRLEGGSLAFEAMGQIRPCATQQEPAVEWWSDPIGGPPA